MFPSPQHLLLFGDVLDLQSVIAVFLNYTATDIPA